MDYDIWTGQYKRLCALYGRTVKGAQAAEYFKAIEGYTSQVIEAAITAVAIEHKTWPSAAVLVSAARGIVRGLTAPRSACDYCYGTEWVDGPPITLEELGGQSYPTVVRCPQCRAA